MTPQNDTMLLKVIDTHVTAIHERIEKMNEIAEDRHAEVMQLIKGAFPDGDLKSHYQYHMRLIEEAQARKAIKLEIWKKVLSGSIWSVLAYCAYEVFKWGQNHVKF